MPNRWHALGVALALAFVLGGPVGVPAQAPTAPDLVLIGLILREGQEGIAVIENRKTKQQRLYRVGAVVAGARLTEILPDRVKLSFQGREVEVRLAGTPGATAPRPAAAVSPEQPTPPRIVPQPGADPSSSAVVHVDRTRLAELIRTPDLAMNVTPIENRGVRVDSVRNSSLFEILGLRRGDVIRNVNGNVPGAAAPLPQVIERTADWGMLRFDVERNGRTEVKYIGVRPEP